MESIFIEIAEFIFQIKFKRYRHAFFPLQFINSIKSQYSNFLIKKKSPDFYIEVSENLPQRLKKEEKNKISFFMKLYELKKNKIFTTYAISPWEFQGLLYIALQQILPKNSSIILHGSAIASKNKAAVFIGPSGAGKSTISKLLSPPYKIIGDDLILVRKNKSKIYCHQLPFVERIGPNRFISSSVELAKIFILKKSRKKFITTKKISALKAISQLVWINYRFTKQKYSFLLEIIKEEKAEYLYFPKDQRLLKKWIYTIFA